MDFTIGKYKINLEIIIIIILLWAILNFHLFCSCSRVKPYEAFSLLKEGFTSGIKKINNDIKKKEGFTSNAYGMNNGETFSRFPEKPIDLNTWKTPNIGIVGSNSFDKLKSYKTPLTPGKGGNLDFLSQGEFKPECCANGSPYSNSEGCACLSYDTSKYLIERGGNAVPFIQGSSF